MQLADYTPSSYFNFAYDEKGRITNVSNGPESAQATTLANISYNGSEVVITQRPKVDGINVVFIETRLTLDIDKKPISRIRTEFREYLPPQNNYTRRTYRFDTTFFEYNSSGYLQKTKHSTLDSDFFDYGNGAYQLNKELANKTRNYTTINGNLQEIKGVENQSITISSNFASQTTPRIFEEIYTYGYFSNFPNKMDFSNAPLLTEIQLPYMNYLPLNKNYTHLPDFITYETVLKTINGTILSSGKKTSVYTAVYNESGFLKTLLGPPPLGPAGNSRVNLIYDR